MTVEIPRLVPKPIIGHNFSADERFKRESGQHIETEAAGEALVCHPNAPIPILQAGYVDHDVVLREVVQHISQGLVPERQEAGKSHRHTSHH